MPRSRSRSRERRRDEHQYDGPSTSRRDDRSERRDREYAESRRGRSRSRSPIRPDIRKGKDVDRYAERERPRSRSRSRSPHRKERRRRSPSSSSSSSSSSSGDSRDRSRSKKKHSNRSRTRSRSRSRSRSRDRHRSKDKDKDRKRRKEEKREKRRRKEEKRARKKAKKAGAVQEYGKYGIIDESDATTKDSEFRAWLIEEKMLNPETVSKPKMKDLFRTFTEEWNTVSLPKKYYDLAAHERKMQSIALGETLLLQDGQYDFRADEAAHARGSKQPAKKVGDDLLSQQALVELRRIQRERDEGVQLKKRGLATKQSLGVRYE